MLFVFKLLTPFPHSFLRSPPFPAPCAPLRLSPPHLARLLNTLHSAQLWFSQQRQNPCMSLACIRALLSFSCARLCVHLFSLFLLFQLRSFHLSLARRSVAIGSGRTCIGASEFFFSLNFFFLVVGFFFFFFLDVWRGGGVSVGLKQLALMQECCILWWFLLFALVDYMSVSLLFWSRLWALWW